MSVEQSARSVSHAEGVDKVRAFQRVLYRSAKQDPRRRFHALVSAAGIPQVVGCGAGVIPQVSRRSYPAVVGW